MKQNKYLIVLGGPTAVGKTSAAIQLSNKLNCDIISADSRQFYLEMEIGTAKPNASELAQAKHHFINTLSIHDNYTVGKFEQDTLSLLRRLFQERDYCILTGGSGLYLNAICHGLDQFPKVDPAIRAELNEEFKQQGLASLVSELKNKDHVYAKRVDLANPQRVIRALEIIRGTQKPFSSFLRQAPVERPFHIFPFYLTMERTKLYDRINLRVDQMITQGLKAEAQSLYPLKHLNSLRTVGYSEWFDHFDGLISDVEAVELIKRNSRRYAKRQITWFKNQGNYLPIEQGDDAIEEIIIHIKEKLSKV